MVSAAFGPTGSWILWAYPLLRVLPLAVSLLQRVTFSKRRKGNPKGFAPAYGPLAGARGTFVTGPIRAQRLRLASLHLHSLCTTASYGRCAPTPGSIPPLSLPTGSKIKIKSYSSLRSLCGVVEGRFLAFLDSMRYFMSA